MVISSKSSTPKEVSILAHGAQTEARHAKRLRADLAVPGIEAAEEQVGRAIGKPAGFNRIQIVNEEQERVAVAGIERCGVLGDVNARIVDPCRPVQKAGNLRPFIAGAVACDRCTASTGS